MNKMTLVILCCSALLTACDSTDETANETVSINNAIEKEEAGLLDKASSLADSAMDSAKETATGAMEAAKDAASEAMESGKDLKTSAIESGSAAIASAKESVGSAVENTVSATTEMTSAAVEKTSDVIASASSDDVKKGESIYKSSCIACHGTGAAGSPKLGDKAAWTSRIAQGNEVLTQHAIKGFKGSTGYMPAKGGAVSLSDDEVSMAVQYMVSQSQ